MPERCIGNCGDAWRNHGQVTKKSSGSEQTSSKMLYRAAAYTEVARSNDPSLRLAKEDENMADWSRALRKRALWEIPERWLCRARKEGSDIHHVRKNTMLGRRGLEQGWRWR